MVKQLITFSFVAFLMTTVVYGQPTAYSFALSPMGNDIGFFITTNPNAWCEIELIALPQGQFWGIEWKDGGTGPGILIGCVGGGTTVGEFYMLDSNFLKAPLGPPIGNAAVDMTDLSFNKRDMKMYSIDAADNLYRDDDGNSIPEKLVGTFPIGGRNVGLAFDDRVGFVGDLYVLDYVTDSIYRVPSDDVVNEILSNITTAVSSMEMDFNSHGSQGLDIFEGTGYHAAFNASFGQGAIIFDSPPSQNGASDALVNQEFPDFPTFSAYMVCDVTFESDVTAGVVQIWSTDTPDGLYQENVTSAVLNVLANDGSGLPSNVDDPSAGMVVPIKIEEVVFDNDTPMNPGDDFRALSITACGLNLNILAGNYWVGLTPIAEFGVNGQSFAIGAAAQVGFEAAIRNPGGDFNFDGNEPAGEPSDMVWFPAGTTLIGTPWELAIQIREPELCGGGRAELYTFDPAGVFDYQFQGEFPSDTIRVGDLTLTDIVCGDPFCPPTSFTTFRGMVISAQLSDFVESDDVRARYNPGFVLNSTEAPVWLEFFANCPTATDSLVESQAGTPGLTYTVEAWNWNTSSYDVLGVQSESFNSDVVMTFATIPADHINTGGDVRSRVGWRKTGLTLNFPWEVRIDQVGWNQ